MDSGISSETRREPVPGGSSPASLLVMVSEETPESISKFGAINWRGTKAIVASAQCKFGVGYIGSEPSIQG